MHDIKAIEANPSAFDAAMQRRGLAPQSHAILALYDQHRAHLQKKEDLQARRNEVAKAIGQAKRSGEDATAVMQDAEQIKKTLAEMEDSPAEQQMHALLSSLPNVMEADIPDGVDENGNKLVRTYKQPVQLKCEPKQHFELGEGLQSMDFSQAAEVSGARFVYLKNDLARLERALASFMLDMHTSEYGYTEVSPPYLVRDTALFGTGQLPKFADDLFVTTDAKYLIPSAEVPLTNLVSNQILAAEELPLRFTAYTPCFRSEAGSAGKDTRGMIRQHQFSKVELVSITNANASKDEHERMVSIAEEVLKRLDLPFRTMVLCTGDTGFSSQKTYDLEVWLPGQNTYREISSCSNCGEFQARRMKARYRYNGDKQTHFVHTLNGSALAVGRTIVAVLENYQQEDGSIAIPVVLQPYMGGKTIIDREKV